MNLAQVMLVLSAEDTDCPHGGVCVKRVEGPYEALTGAYRMQELRAAGWWVHKMRIDIDGHPGVPDGIQCWS